MIKNCPRCAPRFDKFLHSVQNLHQPYLYRDWDWNDGDLGHFRRQWEEVRLEMRGLIVLNMVENLAMTIPLIYTGCTIMVLHLGYNVRVFSGIQVRERHEIMTSLGSSPFEMEYISYNRIR